VQRVRRSNLHNVRIVALRELRRGSTTVRTAWQAIAGVVLYGFGGACLSVWGNAGGMFTVSQQKTAIVFFIFWLWSLKWVSDRLNKLLF
jgi:hypothetical protein